DRRRLCDARSALGQRVSVVLVFGSRADSGRTGAQARRVDAGGSARPQSHDDGAASNAGRRCASTRNGGSAMSVGPPTIARWLVSIATEPAERAFLVDDLDELYTTRRSARGRVQADLWYWRQVLRSIPHLIARRVQPGRA